MTKTQFDKLLKKHGAKELAESFVFPAKLNKVQKKKTDEDLHNALEKRRAAINKEEKLQATLLQLRFQIEDYLSSDHFDKTKTFGFFLKLYIDSLHKKRKEFAAEINIKPAELSQYINNHRTPPQNIIIRLELHSHKTIPAANWYRLSEKKTLHELNSNTSLRRAQKKFVKREAEFALWAIFVWTFEFRNLIWNELTIYTVSTTTKNYSSIISSLYFEQYLLPDRLKRFEDALTAINNSFLPGIPMIVGLLSKIELLIRLHRYNQAEPIVNACIHEINPNPADRRYKANMRELYNYKKATDKYYERFDEVRKDEENINKYNQY